MGFPGSFVCVLSLQLLSVIPVVPLPVTIGTSVVGLLIKLIVPLVTVARLVTDELFIPLAVDPDVTSVANAGIVNNTKKTKHKSLLNILITFCKLIEKPRKHQNTLGMPPLFLSAFNPTCILEACLFCPYRCSNSHFGKSVIQVCGRVLPDCAVGATGRSPLRLHPGYDWFLMSRWVTSVIKMNSSRLRQAYLHAEADSHSDRRGWVVAIPRSNGCPANCQSVPWR